MKRTHYWLFPGLLCPFFTLAQPVATPSPKATPKPTPAVSARPAPQRPPLPTTVQAKNYYLLTRCQERPAVRALLSADTTFARLTRQYLTRLRNAPTDCPTPGCFTERMKLSDADIQTVGEHLTQLYAPGNALDQLVTQDLIPSGMYSRYGSLSPGELLLKAWQQDAGGINFAIGVYAEGKKLNYPAIDSISFRTTDKSYAALVSTATAVLNDELRKSTLFFEPSLTAALRFLELNEREQAADYEPMTTTVNRAAVERIRSVRWADFPYTLILVPGAGPGDLATPLSAIGMLRCRTAALRYREGMTPFLVVSGGKVHPFKTPYNEAIEMKRYLMEKLCIPENAILVEPHARHTTTNLRNTARLIYRYGMPTDKPGLTSTSNNQSLWITNGSLEARCQKELGIIPYRNGKRLSDTEAESYPLPEALQINPTEPLDP